MGDSWFNPVWLVLIAVSLGALATGIGLALKAFSFDSSYLFGAIVCGVGTLGFTAAGLLIPLNILSGGRMLQEHVLADLMMYGVAGLLVIAILCFIVDHLFEFPPFLMLAAGACFAVLLFPWIYMANQDSFNKRFNITIGEPEHVIPRGLDPLAGNRRALTDLNEGHSESDEEMDDAESDISPHAESRPRVADAEAHSEKTGVSENSSTSKSNPRKSGNDWLYDDP